jgi:hypothetical protein
MKMCNKHTQSVCFRIIAIVRLAFIFLFNFFQLFSSKKKTLRDGINTNKVMVNVKHSQQRAREREERSGSKKKILPAIKSMPYKIY